MESFLNNTIVIQERKIAVFDFDGTLFVHVRHYLAEEALYSFAKSNYTDKKDELSRNKMQIITQMLQGNNTGTQYVHDRINFLSGMTKEEVLQIVPCKIPAKVLSKDERSGCQS